MNIKQAYKLGVASGEETAEHGDFQPGDLDNEDAFLEACHEICQNKRQYAGHPGYDFNHRANSDSLWDAFEDGEGVGIAKGWLLRQKEKRKVRREISKMVREAEPFCRPTDSDHSTRFQVWLNMPNRLISGRTKRELRKKLLAAFGL